MNTHIMQMIKTEYQRAIEKHPVFDEWRGPFFAMSVLAEEVGEASKALNDGDIKNAITELAQVAAVSIRFIDYLKDIHQYQLSKKAKALKGL